MTNKEPWSERMEHGVTGDLCLQVTQIARGLAEANPTSIYAYSLSRVCEELYRYFEDEQGIPFEDSMIINNIVAEPFRRLLESNGLEAETTTSTRELRELVQAIHSVRKAPLSYR